MYGGDEVSAIVLDLGSYTCKAGYAGEDSPKAVFPSVVGSIDQVGVVDEVKPEKDSEITYDSKNADKTKTRKLYVGSQALGYRRDQMEVISPFKDGVVDWDIVDNIWNHAFRECLLIDPKEHPMLLAEPSSNTPQQREKAAELMFESYKVPALFVAKNAVLTSFSSGRATSLVVDSGGGSTTVAAVHDGFVLQKLLDLFHPDDLFIFMSGIYRLSSAVSIAVLLLLLSGSFLFLSLRTYQQRPLSAADPPLGSVPFLAHCTTPFFRTSPSFFSVGISQMESSFVTSFGGFPNLFLLLEKPSASFLCLLHLCTVPSHSSCLSASAGSLFTALLSFVQLYHLVQLLNCTLLSEGFNHHCHPRLRLSNSSCAGHLNQLELDLARHKSSQAQVAVLTSPVGGELLTDCMMKSLESKGTTLRPRYSFKKKEIRQGEFQDWTKLNVQSSLKLIFLAFCNYIINLDFPNTTESYKLYSQRAIASDIKESVCRVPDTAFEGHGTFAPFLCPELVGGVLMHIKTAYANVPMTSYELPDGQTIEVGADRFKIPDILFNPSLVLTIPGMESFTSSTSVSGLSQMVIESINRCDVDIRRELFSSILVKYMAIL
ncbi:hypothetical protein ZIOFF_026962 [Zingiber officinale]|uniref:Actin-related protein 4 n=1 Tax=Zingiber officinale TaxID=94328 RepID=A0A8J5LIA8_ZINOF|nr:hypothetical protein ZIOFF_026962 [Zingiber officinale]